MLIQILDNNQQPNFPLDQYKVIFDTWAEEAGMDKLVWLHTSQVDLSSDVIFQTINDSKVIMGYRDLYENDIPRDIRWLEIEFIGPIAFNALTQLVLVTVGLGYMRSVTDSFSTDWADIRTVLSKGSKGYCCAIGWNETHELTARLSGEKSSPCPLKVMSSAMLLNQNLEIKQTFQKVEKLINSGPFSKDALTILNITWLDELPSNNIFLFMTEEVTPNVLITQTIEDPSTHKQSLH